VSAEQDDYLDRTRAQLRELESRARQVIETLGDDDKDKGEQLTEKIRAVEDKIGEVRQNDEVSPEERNELNVLCAELRVEVTTAELDTRNTGEV